jgi:hypothetical protein
MADVQDLPVLVYGRRKDEELFQEETNVRLLTLRGGLITLATSVEPGPQLILMNVSTKEDHLGRSMIGIQFSRFAQEFLRIDRPTHRKSNASTAGSFWEQ